jgi:hypothetical protein
MKKIRRHPPQGPFKVWMISKDNQYAVKRLLGAQGEETKMLSARGLEDACRW